jgi:regulator of replication initiation timing
MVATRAGTDKSLLNTQVDDLAANNAALKTKADGLAVEATQLRADQAKAQELVDKRQAEAEMKEKNLQQCLQAALDSLHGKFLPCLN